MNNNNSISSTLCIRHDLSIPCESHTLFMVKMAKKCGEKFDWIWARQWPTDAGVMYVIVLVCWRWLRLLPQRLWVRPTARSCRHHTHSPRQRSGRQGSRQTCRVHILIVHLHCMPALFAAYLLWPCACFCLSATSRCSIETSGRIEMVFGFFDQFYTAVTKFRYLQKGYFPPEVCRRLWTYKISPLHVDRRNMLLARLIAW